MAYEQYLMNIHEEQKRTNRLLEILIEGMSEPEEPENETKTKMTRKEE